MNESSDRFTTPLTLRRMLLWFVFATIFYSLFTTLPATTWSFAAASLVAIGTLVLDGTVSPRSRLPGILGIAMFAGALGSCALASGLVLFFNPPADPPRPPLPFWPAVFHLMTLGPIRDAMENVAHWIDTVVRYWIVVVAFTVVSLACTLPFLRQRRTRVLMLMNLPGFALGIYGIVILACETLEI